MSYHTILKTSDDFVAALKSANQIAENIAHTINNTDIKVFPYRYWHYNLLVTVYKSNEEVVAKTVQLTCDQNPNSPLEFKEALGEFTCSFWLEITYIVLARSPVKITCTKKKPISVQFDIVPLTSERMAMKLGKLQRLAKKPTWMLSIGPGITHSFLLTTCTCMYMCIYTVVW